MDGFSLGLKKLIFSKKDSPVFSSPRSGREKKKQLWSGNKRGKRDASPFEEVEGSTFKLEDRANDADDIAGVDYQRVSPYVDDDDDGLNGYRDRNASGFEEIDWPDAELDESSLVTNIDALELKDEDVEPLQHNSNDISSKNVTANEISKETAEAFDPRINENNTSQNVAINAGGTACSEISDPILRPKGSGMPSLSESIQGELDDIELRAKAERHKPVTKDQFLSFFDSDGRVVDETELRRTIFKGGVEDEIREEVWQFLFEMYPCNSTIREREVMKTEHLVRYKALKTRWRPLLRQIALDPKSGVRFCPEWLRKRKHSQKIISTEYENEAEISMQARETVTKHTVYMETDAVSKETVDMKQVVLDDLSRENFSNVESKEAEILSSDSKPSLIENEDDIDLSVTASIGLDRDPNHGRSDEIIQEHGNHSTFCDVISYKEKVNSSFVDDTDVQPIADIHGSTVDDIRDAITEAMIEETRYGAIPEIIDEATCPSMPTVDSRNDVIFERLEEDIAETEMKCLPFTNKIVDKDDFVGDIRNAKLKVEYQNTELDYFDPYFQKLDANFSKTLHVNTDQGKGQPEFYDKREFEENVNRTEMKDKVEIENEKAEKMPTSGTQSGEMTPTSISELMIDPEVDNFQENDSSVDENEDKVECLGPLEDFGEVSHQGDANILLDLEDGSYSQFQGNKANLQFQEKENKRILENDFDVENTIAVSALSAEPSSCIHSDLTELSLIKNQYSDFDSFFQESEKESFVDSHPKESNPEEADPEEADPEEADADASDVEEELLALQGGVNLSFQYDTILSHLMSSESEVNDTLGGNDFEEHGEGTTNEERSKMNDKRKVEFEGNKSDTGFVEDTNVLGEKEVFCNDKSRPRFLVNVSNIARDDTSNPCDDSVDHEKTDSIWAKEPMDGASVWAKEPMDGDSVANFVPIALKSDRACDTRLNPPDLSPIKPSKLDLGTGKSQRSASASSMPQWLEQQLKASSPAGTKMKRTIHIHEEGMSQIEDLQSVLSLKEITEKASLVVKNRLVEQAKQPPRSSTPVEEVDNEQYHDVDMQEKDQEIVEQHGPFCLTYAVSSVDNSHAEADNRNDYDDDKIRSASPANLIDFDTLKTDEKELVPRGIELGTRIAREGGLEDSSNTESNEELRVDPETRECRDTDDVAIDDVAIDDVAIDDVAIDDVAIDDVAIDDSAVGGFGLITSMSLSNLRTGSLKPLDSSKKAFSVANLSDQSAFILLKNLDESISKSDSNVYKPDHRNGPSPIPELEKHEETTCVYCGRKYEEITELPDNLSDDFKQYVEIQAKVYAARQVYDVDVVCKALRVIDKDVPRTDRELPSFRGNENPNLLKLRDALITYAFYHPDVGYAQGMNDIMSRFFVAMESEADAYWMFCSYMEHFKGDFLESDMLKKISLVEQLLMKMDRELFDFLQHLQLELIFCHRWLLLSFKREFSYKDGLRIFEIISSRHLEVSSVEAEMERSRERARELEKEEGSRMEEVYISPEYSFDVFVCVAMLHECRDLLMSTNDVASIYQIISSLPQVNDLDTILSRAEDLFFQYCRKSTMDCFQLIEEPVEKILSWKQRLLSDF